MFDLPPSQLFVFFSVTGVEESLF